ncbi:TPA: tail fiber domain-containing protein [Escherichia coli]
MADIKVVRIESLPATTAVTEDDYLVVQQPDLTRRVKIGDVVHIDGTVSHVISFKEGGKLNGPMDFAYFEEEDLYLRWKGEFPHTVPALSSPYSDGGITDAAWMVYTDPSLREELESTIGASMIMTAEGQSVQDVMDVTVQTANDAKALAQRVDFGTVHTVGDVIHLVNFVGPAVIEEGRTTNYPSEAAGEKFLNGVVSRRDTTTVDGIFRGATSGAMYTIAVTNGVATTKRIALRDEFKRLEANNPTRTVIRAGDDLNTAGYLQLDATGRWGMWNQQTASWQPLAIEQGGTGATTLADAQSLFKVPIAAGVKDFLTLPRTAGMEDGKYYPIIVRTDPYYAPATGTDITLVTRSSSGDDLMNCATLQCHYRTGGWTDRGDSFYGVVNFYQNEKALLGMVAPTRGKQEYVAFYAEARAFPVSIYASRNVVEVFTREQDYQVGSVTNNQDGVKFVAPLQSADLNLAVLGDNNTNTRPIVDFKGTSGFYTGGGTQWHYIGTAERYAVMSKMNMPKVELWADGIDYLCYGSPRKALFSNAGFQCASDGTDDLTNGTFTSKCGNGAGLQGQAEFRSTPEAGQVIVRDVVGSAHRFYNFNKDGTFSAPGGFVCHTGAGWNNQFGNNNPSKIMAGNVNGPEGSMVVGGLSVAFSGNYAFQIAGRLDRLYTRSIEGGAHRPWNKIFSHRGTGLDSADLNTYDGTCEGIYHQQFDANSTSERHYPAPYAGTLIVYQNNANNSKGCVQEYITRFGDRYTRVGNMDRTGSTYMWEVWRHDSGKAIQLRQNRNVDETDKELCIHVGGSENPSNNGSLPKDDAVLHYWGNGSTGDRPNVLEFKVLDESQSNWVWHCGTLPDKSRYLSVNGAVNCTSVNQSSDRDLKDNISVIPDALEAIRKMKGYTYTLKENGMPYAGVIAQEVLEALPEAVSSFVQRKEIPNPDQDGTPLITEERFYSVDYAAVTGLLVQVCREQDDKITALEEQVKKLTEVVTGLQEKLK